VNVFQLKCGCIRSVPSKWQEQTATAELSDSAGENFEVVTKFRGREMDERSQLVELVAAQLADDLGLDVPRAAVVDVPNDFADIIPDADDAAMVRNSVGLNFGSIHLGQGFTTWPPERAPHGAQRDQAAAIFAFDTLIQTPTGERRIRICGRGPIDSGFTIMSRRSLSSSCRLSVARRGHGTRAIRQQDFRF